MNMILHIGDIVQLRKQHPCGSFLWKVTFVGADIKLKCETCERIVMLERPVFDKRVKKLVRSAEEGEQNGE